MFPPLTRREKWGLGAGGVVFAAAMWAATLNDLDWTRSFAGAVPPDWLTWLNHSLANGEPPGLSDAVGVLFLAAALVYGAGFFPLAGGESSLARGVSSFLGRVRPWRSRTGYIMASGMLTGILVQALKLAWARPRPKHVFWEGHPFTPWYWPGSLPPLHDWQTGSFPSGHAASVSVLLAFWFVFRDRGEGRQGERSGGKVRLWGGTLFLWMVLAGLPLMGYARVFNLDHWPTDVVAGAGMGLLVPWLLARLMIPRPYLRPQPDWSHHPMDKGAWAVHLVGNSLGLGLSFSLLVWGARQWLHLMDSGPLFLVAAGAGGLVFFSRGIWKLRNL
ncbi:MAG: phosphatase PAP2 family protein [Deltaproteobacteria bacterium]|nr:phosphatase PAP2 family protein [Deltaproteobacteria bacterium]